MAVRFIHTADWQLGKPFAGIADDAKRARVQQERIEVLHRIGALARRHQAAFILVAGDLFDSARVTRSTVSLACHAIGQLGLPVLAIPGNHDHAGPGSLWEQEFYRREAERLAPNFRLLTEPTPVHEGGAVILPCPLRRRAESSDPTAWVRSPEVWTSLPSQSPRILLAHGTIQGFGGIADDEDPSGSIPNLMDLPRLPAADLDYMALGDWHGTREVAPKAWYSGTPEPDRFPKGSDHDAGNTLAVVASRGDAPTVEAHRTARLVWRVEQQDLAEDSVLARLQARWSEGPDALTPDTLLRLELSGSLGLEATARLDRWLESLDALLLRLKLDRRTVLAPTPSECEALARRPGDPLISRVATRLLTLASGGTEEARIARAALRELHAACSRT
ncbi:MAG: DNA repair exonuclease [Verrucomicrobiales bacterium]|nr:DNA repair exonuclease [Verrucomicrobiales bacterium]